MQWIYKNTASSSQRQTLDEGTLQLISGTDLGTNAHTCKTRTTPLHLVVVRQNKCNSFFRHFSFFCPFPLNAKIQKAQLPNFFFFFIIVGWHKNLCHEILARNEPVRFEQRDARYVPYKKCTKTFGKKNMKQGNDRMFIYIYKKDRTYNLNK